MSLEVSELTVHFDQKPVLWDISLQIPQGSMVGIMGPNGAGKSTLLRTTLGLEKAISGSVKILGKPVDKVREQIAYVPQKNEIDWNFPATCLDVVLMGRYAKLKLFQTVTKADRRAAFLNLEKVGLKGLEHRQINELSEGQKQRVFFARALMQDASILFLDEPFAGVDMATEQHLIELLHLEQKQGKTIIIVHHDLNTAASYFDWGVLLNMALITSGPIKDVLKKEWISKAYGKSNILFQEAAKKAEEKYTGAL